MKIITLWEPWASYIALGLKRFETRFWSTGYRGIIGIHASKKQAGYLQQFTEDMAHIHPELTVVKYDELPFGCIVAACRLIDCHRTETLRESLSPLELALGNYDDKRFAWELELIKLPEKPIPAIGKQGIWEWDRVRL